MSFQVVNNSQEINFTEEEKSIWLSSLLMTENEMKEMEKDLSISIEPELQKEIGKAKHRFRIKLSVVDHKSLE